MNRQSNKKITALYCRVGGGKETWSAVEAIGNQQDALIQYAQAHGLENLHIFSDCGFSGTTLDRPEFQHMLREAEAGNVANLVVKDLSRLCRGSSACGELLEVTFPKYGVTVHSVRGGITSPEHLTEMAKARKVLLTLYRKDRRRGRA